MKSEDPNSSQLLQKIYRPIFWSGYFAVLITSFIPIAGELDKIRLGHGVFEIRLDHLLHVSAYFLICMYYLAGQWRGFDLFEKYSLRKFIVYIFLLATVTEFVQIWVPDRAFNVMDWVANVSGIGLGLVVIMIFRSRKF